MSHSDFTKQQGYLTGLCGHCVYSWHVCVFLGESAVASGPVTNTYQDTSERIRSASSSQVWLRTATTYH